MTLPKSVTALRAVTYDTEQIAQDIAEAYDKPISEVTLDEVMEWVADNAAEDLSNSYNEAFYKDQDGEVIQWS